MFCFLIVCFLFVCFLITTYKRDSIYTHLCSLHCQCRSLFEAFVDRALEGNCIWCYKWAWFFIATQQIHLKSLTFVIGLIKLKVYLFLLSTSSITVFIVLEYSKLWYSRIESVWINMGMLILVAREKMDPSNYFFKLLFLFHKAMLLYKNLLQHSVCCSLCFRSQKIKGWCSSFYTFSVVCAVKIHVSFDKVFCLFLTNCGRDQPNTLQSCCSLRQPSNTAPGYCSTGWRLSVVKKMW